MTVLRLKGWRIMETEWTGNNKGDDRMHEGCATRSIINVTICLHEKSLTMCKTSVDPQLLHTFWSLNHIMVNFNNHRLIKTAQWWSGVEDTNIFTDTNSTLKKRRNADVAGSSFHLRAKTSSFWTIFLLRWGRLWVTAAQQSWCLSKDFSNSVEF